MMTFGTKNGRDVINFKDVSIISRNFRGEKGEYNRDGARNFCIVLTPDEANELAARGFRPRIKPSRNNPDEVYCFIPVTVSYLNYPPEIYRVVGKKMTLMKESTVGVLDSSDIVKVDCTVNCRYWEVNGTRGIKLYVTVMYVTVEENAFANQYADYEIVE